MSGHTRWNSVAPLPDRAALEVQLAYLDGYCLALEDALKDLAHIPIPNQPGATREIKAFQKAMRLSLATSLESARFTRKWFQDHYEGKIDGATTTAILGEDLPGDLAGLPRRPPVPGS